jgi:hypothetical protein
MIDAKGDIHVMVAVIFMLGVSMFMDSVMEYHLKSQF